MKTFLWLMPQNKSWCCLILKSAPLLIKSCHLVGVSGELNYSIDSRLLPGIQVSSGAWYDQSNKLPSCWDAAEDEVDAWKESQHRDNRLNYTHFLPHRRARIPSCRYSSGADLLGGIWSIEELSSAVKL